MDGCRVRKRSRSGTTIETLLGPIVSDASVGIVSAGKMRDQSKGERSILLRQRDVRGDELSKCSDHL
jgi:hypothetical protein